jgi:hypothetical protein
MGPRVRRKPDLRGVGDARALCYAYLSRRDAGVGFIAENGEGPGVRLRKGK